MNNIIHTTPIPLPETGITVRPATLDDVDFLDALQKKTTKQVGFMPRKQFEGKVAAGHVLIAEEVGSGEWGVRRNAGDASSLSTPHSQLPTRVGYLIGNDQYFKRDDVGIIYQMNVVPERRRSLVAATLLKAQFERSAYGCKLYCCWCAQDIEANRFWEAMGFVPIAFRVGSLVRGSKSEVRGEEEASSRRTTNRKPRTLSPRVHIFWQKRIRQGDVLTPWWFPSLTTGGSIREDRIVLPIPPGTHWSEVQPVILPGSAASVERGLLSVEKKPREPKRQSTIDVPQSAPRGVQTMGLGRLSFFEVPTPVVVAPEPAIVEKPKREKKAKQKHDPKVVAAARELRDRYLDHYNAQPICVVGAKYEVGRVIESTPTADVVGLLSAA